MQKKTVGAKLKNHQRNVALVHALLETLHEAVLGRFGFEAISEDVEVTRVPLTREMAAILCEAILRAERGDSDPFRLKWNGRPPALNRAGTSYCVEKFYYLRNINGLTHQEALEAVAQALGVSEKTVQNVIRDEPEYGNYCRRLFRPKEKPEALPDSRGKKG